MLFKKWVSILLISFSFFLISCGSIKKTPSSTDLNVNDRTNKKSLISDEYFPHPVNSLQFKDLVRFSNKPVGINSGGIYLVKGTNQKVYVKEFVSSSPEDHSLILSYQMSRLLSLISPDQGPIVVPVLGGRSPMLASYDMSTFTRGGGEDGERSILLHLVLDLMDINDRHSENIGTVLSGGTVLAAVVDMDMSDNFRSDWLLNLKKDYFKKKDGLFSALSTIMSFSDKTIKTVYEAGIHELDQSPFLRPIRKSFNVDYIFSQILHRKHQMEWVHKHFESVVDILESESRNETPPLDHILKAEDISDDRYGFFFKKSVEHKNYFVFSKLLSHGARDADGSLLLAALKNNSIEIFKALLSHGAKDREGKALQVAVENNRFEMFEALLSHGAEDREGKALQVAVENNRFEMFNALLSHGAKDPDGWVLRAAVENNSLDMFNALLSQGAKDPYGWALQAAVENTRFEMFNALLSHGAKDPEGWALRAAVENNRHEIFNTLLSQGAKDPEGMVLRITVENNRFEMFNALLSHGAKDPYGWALRAAVKNTRFDMFNALLSHGAKDPEGWALRAAVENNSLDIFNALLSHGVRDPKGWALRAAVENNNLEMFEILVSRGVSRDPEGEILQFCREREKKKWFWEKNPRMIKLLEEIQSQK